MPWTVAYLTEMLSTNAKGLFCFEFFVESIEMISNSVNVQSMEIKFNDYEWFTISHEEWNNIGKRCYLINEANFLDQMVSRNLHIRAICNDRSVYSCTVSLGSFHGSENTANCKGLMKLYPLDKSCPNLHMRVSMRVYNVDRVNPAIFPRTVLAVDQNTQTEWRTMNRKIQIGVTIRHAAVQQQQCAVITKDAAVQISASISQKQLANAIRKIVNQLLSTKMNKNDSMLQKYHDKNLVTNNANRNQVEINNRSRRNANLSTKLVSKKLEPENEKNITKLTNLNSNYSNYKIDRICKRQSTNSNSINRFREQHCRSNIINNNSFISYNAICRRQLLYKLDRLIAEKMIILQKINNAKSANLNSKPKRKIERYCQQYGYNSSSNYQLSKQYDATISAKNSANIRMFNGKSLLRNVKNQNLTQKRNEKINDYCSDNKIAPSTRTLSDDNSDSTSAWNLSEKRRDHMKINANVSDISTGNKTNDKEESTDNENNESTSTAIQITSDDFSSEALTVSELETIK